MPIDRVSSLDRDPIREVHGAAFPEGEQEIVSKRVIPLLLEKITPPTLSLIAQIQGAVVGHVVFMVLL